MRVMRFWPSGNHYPMVVSTTREGLNALWEQLEQGEDGYRWTLELGTMDEKEFSNLPEHEGW